MQSRESIDRGLPLALLTLESCGTLKDRVRGVTQTTCHVPYYIRDVVSPAQVPGHEGGVIRAQAHYAVFRTKPGDAGEVCNVGRCVNELLRDASGAQRFRLRRCLHDNEMVLNSLICP